MQIKLLLAHGLFANNICYAAQVSGWVYLTSSRFSFCSFLATMKNMKNFVTNNFKETQKLGELLAKEISGGQIICLSGDLGSGKTTFTQGFLKGLKVKGPYTSPTFVVMKQYVLKDKNIYHVDAYRIKAKDILNLGWEEMIKNKNNIIIIEWADRIKKIIPKDSVWIKFEWQDEHKRKMTFMSSRALSAGRQVVEGSKNI